MHIDKNNPIKYEMKIAPKSIIYFQFRTKGSKNISKINANVHIYYKDPFQIGKNYLAKSGTQSVYTSTIDTVHNVKMQAPDFSNPTQSFIYLWAESGDDVEIENTKIISSTEFAAAQRMTIMPKIGPKSVNRHKGQKVIKQQRVVSSKPLVVSSKPSVVVSSKPSIVASPKITFFVFLGEFGYEILSSHGWLRLLKSKHPNFKIGVASRGGVEFLYEDCCDIYVDITDILSKYISDSFGIGVSNEDKEKIYKRCCKMCKGYTVKMVYSNLRYHKNGIEYGVGNNGPYGSIRDHRRMQKQKFKLLTLSKYKKERECILGKFPGLSIMKYVILHDRRRNISWGQNEINGDIWKDIINRLVQEGYLVVLIGYKPYKKDDAHSIFNKDEFGNIPGTINISDFLNNNINKNILYQALIIQNAEFYLGIWGSAGYLPPLLGTDSYLLTLGRKKFVQIKKEVDLWNKFLCVRKARMYCIDTTTDKKSIIDALENINIFKKLTKETERTHNFLSVLIRTHKRSKLLKRCIDSLNKQTKKNFVIILISDCKEDNVENIISGYPNLSFMIKYVEPLGFPSCNIYFNKVKDMINSDYIVFIDDDDEVIDNTYFDALENISAKKPVMIMSRALFPNNRILPEDKYWNKFPIRKHIGSLNFCVRSDIFKKFDWPAARAGDYHFVFAIFNNINWKRDVYWHNKVTTSVTHIGLGKEEET